MSATFAATFTSFSFLILTLICINFSNQTNPNLEADCGTDIIYNCTDQQFVLFNESTRFSFDNKNVNLLKGTCTFTFIVPKYIHPTIFGYNTNLTYGNSIFAKQTSDYGGEKIYYTNTTVSMAPVNFSLHFSFPNSHVGNTFSLIIQATDITPKKENYFPVQPNLTHVLDSNMVNGMLSVQKFDGQQQKTKVQVRVITFKDFSTYDSNPLDSVFIFDNGVYKGSLLDVSVAQNQSRICEGSQFSFLVTNSYSHIFSILVSPEPDWTMPLITRTSQFDVDAWHNCTALDGPTVYYEILDSYDSYRHTNFEYSNGTFEGNGQVDVYAGCVTSQHDPWRIATLNSTNIESFNGILFPSKCVTFVISSGSFKWYRRSGYYNGLPNQKIGQLGVLMNYNFPYVNDYLYKTPQDDGIYVYQDRIVVKYDVGYISNDSFFLISQVDNYGDKRHLTKELTSTDTEFTSDECSRQKIRWSVPIGSKGFLVRFTVLKSADNISYYSSMLIFMLSWLF